MKIVCTSDTHGKTADFVVPDGDVLVHAGDLSMGGTRTELESVARWLDGLPHAHKVIIAGNHDWGFEREPEMAREIMSGCCTYLEDSEVTIEGIRFYGSPWQPWFFDWAFNLQRGAQIKEKWDLIPEGIDVLITHGPPHGILDETRARDLVGCEELLLAVQRIHPKLHVFGHIHEGYGQQQEGDTLYVNPSACTVQDEALNPPIIVEL